MVHPRNCPSESKLLNNENIVLGDHYVNKILTCDCNLYTFQRLGTDVCNYVFEDILLYKPSLELYMNVVEKNGASKCH